MKQVVLVREKKVFFFVMTFVVGVLTTIVGIVKTIELFI
jgi:hypothetical protein